jgi:ribosomal protein S18 acetylase RimI-like enzyme
MGSPTFVQVQSSPHIETARELFLEYQSAIGIDLSFQNFSAEVADLPGEYAPPAGRLYLCLADGLVAGCVALRKIDEQKCELKRMYIRPAYRGQHLGRLLAERVIQEAQTIGYQAMRLDTLPAMTEAIALYQSLGFRPTEAYRINPHPGAIYMELALVLPSR